MPTTKAPLIEFSHAAGCEFHTPFAASRVDRANGIIREVGLITSWVKARGHELHVDDTTLAQMLACANTRGNVPRKQAGSVCESWKVPRLIPNTWAWLAAFDRS